MMIHKNALNKENNVKGMKKAKPAPDFSKLHKQWDTRLQKTNAEKCQHVTCDVLQEKGTSQDVDVKNQGKAVAKKPLTTMQPFTLTDKHPISSKSSSSSSGEEFETDEAAKERILSGESEWNQDFKPHRATIATNRRTPIKSQIPRSSFCTARRASEYTKVPIKRLPTTTPNARVVVPKPSIITNSSPSVKRAAELQGFTVNFETDDNALQSILNCEPIPLNNNTPARLSSQCGPQKSKRIKGRVVPFQKPIATSRFSLQARSVSQASETKESKQHQRWSIYSRDSFSTKPDLMTWLKTLVDKPAPNSRQSFMKTNPHNNIANNKNDRSSFSVSQKPRAGEGIFSKTLIGYQGDHVTEKTEKTTKEKCSVPSLSTPMKTLPIAISDTSAVKSILKKSTLKTVVEHTSSLKTAIKTPNKKTTFAEKTPIKTPQKTKENTLFADRTPLRLSAYAPNQRLLGLPLPKENRYERLGECITGPVKTTIVTTDQDDVTAVQSLSSDEKAVSSTPQSAVKRVRWATNLRNSLGADTKSEDNEVTLSLSPGNNAVPPQPSCSQDTKVTTTDNNDTAISTSSCSNTLPSSALVVAKDESSIVKNSPLNESWSEILIRHQPSVEEKPTSRTLFSDICSHEQISDKKVKKSRSRSNKRNSVLERIYGDAITFVSDENTTATETTSKAFHDTSTLPLPSLDEKTIEDIMNSHGDDDEDFTGTFMRPMRAGNDDEHPLQSTMIKTPSVEGSFVNTPSVLVNTPSSVLDDDTPPSMISMSLNETLSKIPEAPKRVNTKARTPYKKAMLDYLEKAMATWSKNNDETLDCTLAPDQNNTTLKHDVICEESVVPTSNNKNIAIPTSDNENVTESENFQIFRFHESENEILEKFETTASRSNHDSQPTTRTTADTEVLLDFDATLIHVDSFKKTKDQPSSLILNTYSNEEVPTSRGGMVNILSPSMKTFPSSHTFTSSSTNSNKQTGFVESTAAGQRSQWKPSISATTGSILKPSLFGNSLTGIQLSTQTNEMQDRFSVNTTTSVEQQNDVIKPAVGSTTSTSAAVTYQRDDMKQNGVLKPVIKPTVLSTIPTNIFDSTHNPNDVIKPAVASTIPTNTTNFTCQQNDVIKPLGLMTSHREDEDKHRALKADEPHAKSKVIPNDVLVVHSSKPLLKPPSFIPPETTSISSITQLHQSNQVPLFVTSQAKSQIFSTATIAASSSVSSFNTSSFFSRKLNVSQDRESTLKPALFVPTVNTNLQNITVEKKLPFTFTSKIHQHSTALPIDTTDLFNTLNPNGGVFKSAARSFSQSSKSTFGSSSSSLLKPSKFAERLNSNKTDGELTDGDLKDTMQQTNDTTMENSVFEDDTDVCVVFSKPKSVNTGGNGDVNQALSQAKLIGVNSAFRRVPAICNIVPKTTVKTRASTEQSSEMKKLLLFADYVEKRVYTRDSVLNAEISLYSKFGEIAGKYVKIPQEKRNGATCALKKLLNHGDEQHFIPIDGIIS